MLPEEVDEVRSFAQFQVKAVPDDKATEERGELVLRDAIVLKVAHSKNQIIEIEADATHAKKFPREWAVFKATEEYQAFIEADKEAGNMTPIEQLKALPAITQTLRSMGFRSVEAFVLRTKTASATCKAPRCCRRRQRRCLNPRRPRWGTRPHEP